MNDMKTVLRICKADFFSCICPFISQSSMSVCKSFLLFEFNKSISNSVEITIPN